jgi:hypothetical protein
LSPPETITEKENLSPASNPSEVETGATKPIPVPVPILDDTSTYSLFAKFIDIIPTSDLPIVETRFELTLDETRAVLAEYPENNSNEKVWPPITILEGMYYVDAIAAPEELQLVAHQFSILNGEHYESIRPFINYDAYVALGQQGGSLTDMIQITLTKNGGEPHYIVVTDGKTIPALQPMVDQLTKIRDAMRQQRVEIAGKLNGNGYLTGMVDEQAAPAPAENTTPTITPSSDGFSVGQKLFYSLGTFTLNSIVKLNDCSLVGGAAHCYAFEYTADSMKSTPISIDPWIWGTTGTSTGQWITPQNAPCPGEVASQATIGTLMTGEFKTGTYCVYYSTSPNDILYELRIVPTTQTDQDTPGITAAPDTTFIYHVSLTE